MRGLHFHVLVTILLFTYSVRSEEKSEEGSGQMTSTEQTSPEHKATSPANSSLAETTPQSYKTTLRDPSTTDDPATTQAHNMEAENSTETQAHKTEAQDPATKAEEHKNTSEDPAAITQGNTTTPQNQTTTPSHTKVAGDSFPAVFIIAISLVFAQKVL